jgi:hypothetical protein
MSEQGMSGYGGQGMGGAGQGEMGQGEMGQGSMGQGSMGQGSMGQGSMGQGSMGQGGVGQAGMEQQGMPYWQPYGYAPHPMMGYPPGMGQMAAPPAGHGMAQVMHEIANGGNGLSSLTKMLDLDDKDFWKGALVGAAAVLLLTNENVQRALFRGAVKGRDAVEEGVEKVKEGVGTVKQKVREAKEKADE